jgi:serine/threonine-protein kinase
MLKDKNKDELNLIGETPDIVSGDKECSLRVTGTSESEEVQKPQDGGIFDAVKANLPDFYTVLSLVGEGGMGAVFRVSDQRLGKEFAVKILRPQLVQDRGALRRFEQEAQAARGLTHANLAAIYDYGIGKQGAPYLVMDYLDGRSLDSIIEEEKSLAIPRAIDLFVQIAEAVGHAHNKGVIHRDVKPSNILVEQ